MITRVEQGCNEIIFKFSNIKQFTKKLNRIWTKKFTYSLICRVTTTGTSPPLNEHDASKCLKFFTNIYFLFIVLEKKNYSQSRTTYQILLEKVWSSFIQIKYLILFTAWAFVLSTHFTVFCLWSSNFFYRIAVFLPNCLGIIGMRKIALFLLLFFPRLPYCLAPCVRYFYVHRLYLTILLISHKCPYP